MKGIVTSIVLAMAISAPAAAAPVRAEHLDLANRLSDAQVHRDDAGQYVLTFKTNDGVRQTFTPAEFAAAVEAAQRDQREHGFLFVLFNITGWWGVLWVAIGLGGQMLFTVRMLIQWLVSEKSKRSVVPVSFWWLSLAGATMLILYFLWRKDIVGVLGQSTGWLIYIRNLWMIHLKQPVVATDDPGPEPELAR